MNHAWENMEGGSNARFQRWKPRSRGNGGFVNNALSSWNEIKIEHFRNAIDVLRGAMLEITEKQEGPDYVSQHCQVE